MTKTNKILIGILLLSLLLLSIGYSAIQNITLDINGTATAVKVDQILKTGSDFNQLLKETTSKYTSDTIITRIVFDYWEEGYIEDGNIIFTDSNWESGTPIDVEEKGGIRLFKEDEGATAYILSEAPIYANSSSDYMFYYFENVKSIEFNNFDTSKVTNTKNMFHTCKSITELDLSSFNTSNVTDMHSMFYLMENVEYINVSSFDTSNVTNLKGMFSCCYNLKQIDVGSFDTSKVTDISNMFGNCNKLDEIDVSSFNTSKVENFSYMFYNCINLTKLDVSSFNTSSATNMKAMLGGLISLNNIDVSNFDTSKVTTMDRMFNSSNFKTLDLSSFDTSKVTNMTKMFSYNKNLRTIYVSNKWTTENVNHSNITIEEEPFNGCTNLVGGTGTAYDSSHIDISYARIDGGQDSETPGYLTLKQ